MYPLWLEIYLFLGLIISLVAIWAMQVQQGSMNIRKQIMVICIVTTWWPLLFLFATMSDDDD